MIGIDPAPVFAKNSDAAVRTFYDDGIKFCILEFSDMLLYCANNHNKSIMFRNTIRRTQIYV